jgi:hypothetical protein
MLDEIKRRVPRITVDAQTLHSLHMAILKQQASFVLTRRASAGSRLQELASRSHWCRGGRHKEQHERGQPYTRSFEHLKRLSLKAA